MEWYDNHFHTQGRRHNGFDGFGRTHQFLGMGSSSPLKSWAAVKKTQHTFGERDFWVDTKRCKSTGATFCIGREKRQSTF